MNRIILSILLIIPICSSSQTQLKLNDTISKSISSIKNHNYELHLQDSQFAFLTLNQIGVDVAITTFDVDGKKMGEFDSPNGRFGPEIITINSTKEGVYRLKVKSIDSKDVKGTYRLHVQNITKQASTPFEEVDQVFLPWGNSQTPGAAVAIIKKGKVIYKNTYGSANLEYDIPITTKTVFRTGSVAKQFTAFSILLLEQKGQLSLEDDIRKYISEVPDFGHKITLRHLANHTSGLREESVLTALMGWDEGDIVTREQILKVVSKQKELNFIPGEQYLYCNTGYTLLAEVVSRVSGKSFTTFTKEHIFEPLGMSETQFLDNPKTIIKNKAYSCYNSGNSYVKAIINDANPGSSGMLTTIDDLTKWVLNFQKPSVGSFEIFNKMKASGILNDGTQTNYGFGIETLAYNGLKDIGHGGALGGFRAKISTFTEQDFALVMIANTPSIHPLNIPNKIVDIFLKDEFLAQKKIERNASLESEPLIKTPFDKEDMVSYLGTYYSEELATQYDFVLKNNKPVLMHPRLEIELIASSKDEFTIGGGWAAANINFTRDDDNHITGFKFSIVNTKNIGFQKIPYQSKQ